MSDDFIGRRWAFPPQLGDRNRMTLVTDHMAIRQALYVIIHTVPGERVMRPEFGCRIHELIFHPANHQTAAVAERFVREAINRWEPRIDLQAVEVSPGATDYGELYIRIIYSLKDEHNARNLVYPYYLLPKE